MEKKYSNRFLDLLLKTIYYYAYQILNPRVIIYLILSIILLIIYILFEILILTTTKPINGQLKAFRVKWLALTWKHRLPHSVC